MGDSEPTSLRLPVFPFSSSVVILSEELLLVPKVTMIFLNALGVKAPAARESGRWANRS